MKSSYNAARASIVMIHTTGYHEINKHVELDFMDDIHIMKAIAMIKICVLGLPMWFGC